MEKLIVSGGKPLNGHIKVSGAKNVAMKVLLAGLLTDDELIIHNMPAISSVVSSSEMLKQLGVTVSQLSSHTVSVKSSGTGIYSLPLEMGGVNRAATMVMGPLLARYGKAIVPNPGGCRIGKRPIDRHIDGLKAMGAEISYNNDGFFSASTKGLHGTHFAFTSNSHTGTEALILAAVLAEGETIIENAAEEPEVDDLIQLLIRMGAHIKRSSPRTIVIEGVTTLHGTEFEIMPDRNEVVTFAIGAIASRGDVIVEGAKKEHLEIFLELLTKSKASWEILDKDKIRFNANNICLASDITTLPHPGFMTDWQAPWALLMTQAKGVSTIHETIYEERFGFVPELVKMGAKIELYDPRVEHPEHIYNFNWSDRKASALHAIRISGPTKLHNAVLEVCDLRAGATVVLAALIADGESVIQGIEHIDRGYEDIEGRLRQLGANIERIEDAL